MSTKKDLVSLAKTLGINTNLERKTKQQIKDLIKDYKTANNINILKESSTPVKYVYHCADLHIRTLDRHREYAAVFENLYAKLKGEESQTLDDSVFVICGDIFHNRDRLTSETIILFDSFIKNLTNLIDVVIILGNHDVFSHADRLDVLTGIVSLKSTNNLFFLKTSGVYKYKNIDFHVSSLLDKKFLRCPKPSMVEGVQSINVDGDGNSTINIALYHGPVQNCKLDNDFIYQSSSAVRVVDFNYYDYVLLGDIHKRQLLKENIAYPGSLIQQNHKEDLVHGILKWDLETKKSEFIEIGNEYSFQTIQLTDSIDYSTFNFSKYSYIKIVHDYLYELDVEKVKKEISKYTQIVSFTKEIKGGLSDIKSKDHFKKKDDTDYLNSMNIDPVIKNDLVNLHNTYLAKHAKGDQRVPGEGTWAIESIEFSNMFIYGDDNINTIDFKEGVTGILGNNAIGKSAIINIILYCLFGNIFKTKTFLNRNIINKKSKDFYVKMVVTIPTRNTKYTITRRGSNKKRGENVSLKEEISIVEDHDGVTTNLSESTKCDTSKKIMEILNLSDKDSFILTNVLSYTNYSTLLTMTNMELSSKLSNLFNISVYSEIYSAALKDYKAVTTKILENNTVLQKLNTFIDDTLHTKNENMKKEIDSLQESVDILTRKMNLIVEKEISLGPSLDLQKCPERPVEEIQTEINRLESVLHDKTFRVSKREILNDLDTLEINDNFNDEMQKASKQITDLLRQKVKLKGYLDDSEIESLKNNEQFSVEAFIEDIKNCKGKVLDDDLHDDLLELLKSINSKEYLNNAIKLVEYNGYLQDYKWNNSIEEKIQKLLQERTKSRSKAKKDLNTELELALESEKLELLKTEIRKAREYNDNLENIKKKECLTREKNDTSKKYKLLSERLFEKSVTYKKNLEDLEKQEKTKNEILGIEETLIESRKKENIYKIYKDLCKELPKRVLIDTLKKIEIEINKMVYSFIGLYIQFNKDPQNNDWEILIKKGNMYLGTEHLSGYERFIINVFLKVTLDKYKFYDKGEIFIIDECFDAVSEENFNSIKDIFDILKQNYKTIIIVSHNEQLKKMVDHRIIITTDFACSKIN